MFKGKLILIVDDEVELRSILREELEFHGADVIEAHGGYQALQQIQTNPVDVVVSDIRMPEGDGITLLQSIRKLNPKKPSVYLVTGFSDLKKEEAFSLGAQGILVKPFNLEEVSQMIGASFVK